MHVVYTMQMSLIMIWLFRCECESTKTNEEAASRPIPVGSTQANPSPQYEGRW